MHGVITVTLVRQATEIYNCRARVTYYYDENDWSNECPYKVSIVPQPAPE